MGFRGRAPKPTAIKKLQGNAGHRRLNPAEPTLPAGVPECPDYLDDVAKKEWARLTKLLLKMKVLTEADYIALGILCQGYSTSMQAYKQLAKSGLLYKSKSGYVQQSPLLGIIRTQSDIVTNLLKEFGLTASSRTRICVASTEAKPVNRFAALDLIDNSPGGPSVQ